MEEIKKNFKKLYIIDNSNNELKLNNFRINIHLILKILHISLSF